ncbi:hypothetical protein CXF71_16100 [Colwellia sp. 12G3]|nr:hypothetical protein CXF71_16100 [Colwellia sp. 12G3]
MFLFKLEKTYMIYEEHLKKSIIENSDKPLVTYPFYEKLILDNDKVSIVTYENKNNIRIGEALHKVCSG